MHSVLSFVRVEFQRGTGPEAVQEQLEAARRALLPVVETQGRVNDLRWVA